jgi:3-keto-disaccharide hydrolase
MRFRTPRSAVACLVLLVCLSRVVVSQSPQPLNQLTPAERDSGWKLLFDGKTTAGWRVFHRQTVSPGWKVVDGAITRVAEAGDLITDGEYRNFELTLEWNISPKGNSGIFYRGTEEYDAIYWSAPEMQVLDDAGHPDGKSRLTAAGSCYALYPSPAGIVRPPGQWNQVRIVVNGQHVEHWLNGTKVVEYELGSPDWTARVAQSKFHQYPDYGRAERGHIGLQDHESRVAFRNIKIRELP